MAIPFQGLFGQVGTGTGFGGLLDPRSQAMLGAAQALTQAGGPTRMPVSTGAALSSAMANASANYRSAQAAGMQQQMNKMQYDAAVLAAQNRKAFTDAQASGDQAAIRRAAAAAYPGKAAEAYFRKPQYKQRKIPVRGVGGKVLYQSQESNDGGQTWTNLGPAAPASASTNVSVSMGQSAGEGLLKDWRGLVDSGRQAKTNLSTVNQMQTLLEGGVNTGFAQPMMLDIQRAYQRFDPNYKIESVAGGEAFAGLSNKIILPLVKQLGVNPTDKDLDFIVKGSPELAKSPAGNRLMLKALEVSQQRQIRMSQLATQWMQENAAAIESGTLSLWMAQIKFTQYLQDATVNDPVFKKAADDMRGAYAAISQNPLTKSSAEDAAEKGGFVTQ
jgi:hypothetical protein